MWLPNHHRHSASSVPASLQYGFFARLSLLNCDSIFIHLRPPSSVWQRLSIITAMIAPGSERKLLWLDCDPGECFCARETDVWG